MLKQEMEKVLAPKAQAGEKIYKSFEEAKKAFMPKSYKQKSYKFVSQKSNKEIYVLPITVMLPHSIKVLSTDRDKQDPVLLTQLIFGGYKIKFSGNEYISKNLIEYKALYNKPGIVCVGPVKVSKEKPKPKVSKEKPEPVDSTPGTGTKPDPKPNPESGPGPGPGPKEQATNPDQGKAPKAQSFFSKIIGKS